MSSLAPSVTLLRPQPLGVFDGPAGLILIRADQDVPELLERLSRGELPNADAWPAAAAPFAAALSDDVEGALEALTDDPLDVINRFVLAPTEEHHADAMRVAREVPELRAVVAAAAYASGLSDLPPRHDRLTGEFASLVATVAASDALDRGDRLSARRWLERAIEPAVGVGPALEGRARAAAAEMAYQVEGATPVVADAYAAALRALERTDLDVIRAGAQVQRAVVLHQRAADNRGLLIEAIRLYQSALIVLTETAHPDQFAFASMNIALAILALPTIESSDQVRLGVAVQSLRAALRIYTRERDPDQWSSGRLNLANALQYLPSGHRVDNLTEAVEIYEDLLTFRSPQRDPAGYARVLANQANALAHLGILDHAEEKYGEARMWFTRLGEDDAVQVIDEQLAKVAEARSEEEG